MLLCLSVMDGEDTTEDLEAQVMKEEHSVAIDSIEPIGNSKGSVFTADTGNTVLCEDAVALEKIVCTESPGRNNIGSPSSRSSHQMSDSPQSLKGSNAPSGVLQELEPSESDLANQHEADDDVQDCMSATNPTTTKKKFSDKLRLLTGSWKDFGDDNYLRGCKWSPDGTCVLCCSNDNIMRLYNLPSQLYSDATKAENLPEMSSALNVPQGEAVYDFCWYPQMNSWRPNTCCFVTSCKDHPVQLWDAFVAERRTAYVPYNDMDEVISPHSLAFSLDGERLYTGFNKFIKIFNISRPGRECTTIRTYERKKGGQPGIVSCIAMHPSMPGTFALGSYSCSVGLYSDDYDGPLMLLTGISNGVTHLQLSCDGNLLHTGFRKCDLIQSWDLRNPGKILYEMKRAVHTNQRIYFDLYDKGNYIVSGSSDGHIYGWCLDSDESECEHATLLSSCFQCKVHNDAVNGVSVHPTLPLLATCSGQRTFSLPTYGSDGEGSADSDMDEDKGHENSLKLWLLLDE